MAGVAGCLILCVLLGYFQVANQSFGGWIVNNINVLNNPTTTTSEATTATPTTLVKTPTTVTTPYIANGSDTVEKPVTVTSQCDDFREISSIEKRQYNYKRTEDVLQDNSIVYSKGEWYGLEGYKLWQSAPEIEHCGTYWPVWMEGTPPGQDDGITEVKMCQNDGDDTCADFWYIKVKSCGDYHVYQLERTGDNSAYCIGTLQLAASSRTQLLHHQRNMTTNRMYYWYRDSADVGLYSNTNKIFVHIKKRHSNGTEKTVNLAADAFHSLMDKGWDILGVTKDLELSAAAEQLENGPHHLHQQQQQPERRVVYENRKPSLYQRDGPINPEFDIPTETLSPRVIQHLEHKTSKSLIYFQCEFDDDIQVNLYYQTIWYINNAKFFTTAIEKGSVPKPELLQKLKLTEKDLNNGGIETLGFSVQCHIKLRSNEEGAPTTAFSSEEKFIGVRIIQDSIAVTSGNFSTIQFESTVSIGCGSLVHDADCGVDIFLLKELNPSSPQCDPEAMVPSSCGIRFRKRDDTSRKELKITGKMVDLYDQLYATTKFRIKSGSRVTGMPIWKNYDIGTITVEVTKEKTSYKMNECYAVCDPHMKTSDGVYYEHQCAGIFTMYKHTMLPIEVQIETDLCNNDNAYCVCAVAVRSGRTVFHVNYCNSEHRKGYRFVSCEENKSSMRVNSTGATYSIFLPTGTNIKVYLVNRQFLNVHIFPSSLDKSKIEGLCGNFNGNGSDDIRPRGSDKTESIKNTYNQCFREFSFSWSVQPDQDLSDDNVVNNLETYGDIEYSFCTCENEGETQSQDVTCSPNIGDTCIHDYQSIQLIDPEKCVVSSKRRKRSNQFHCTGACIGNPARKKREEREKRSTFTNGWTEEAARQHCEQAFNVTSVQLCDVLDNQASDLTSSIMTCIYDIELTGTVNYTMSALETYKEACKRNVQLNSSLQTSAEGQEVLASICPNECSNNGICKGGICSCNENFKFTDCSVNISVAPITNGLDKETCDPQKEQCDEVLVRVDIAVNTSESSCHLNSFVITADGSENAPVESESWLKSKIPHYSRVVCTLPSKPSMYGDALAYGYWISVSHNNQSFSKEKNKLLIFDTNCVSCTSGTPIECRFTKPACVYGGQCFDVGKSHPTYKCTICESSKKGSAAWNGQACSSASTQLAGTNSVWYLTTVLAISLHATFTLFE